MPEAVLDASAVVDLLLGNDVGFAVRRRIAGHVLHAPAHLDAEVFSAVGRLNRASVISEEAVERMLTNFTSAPIREHSLRDLLVGAWARRHQLRLVDALYVELATALRVPLITTDRRFVHPIAEVVGGG